MDMMLATIALLGTASTRPPIWVLVIISLMVCLVVFALTDLPPLMDPPSFLQFRFRNRKVMKLLKRYAKWWGWVKAGKYPKWMNVSYSWDGLVNSAIRMKRYTRILGVKKFEDNEYWAIRGLEKEDEIHYLKALMEEQGVDSPEEFDLWLSQRGF